MIKTSTFVYQGKKISEVSKKQQEKAIQIGLEKMVNYAEMAQ